MPRLRYSVRTCGYGCLLTFTALRSSSQEFLYLSQRLYKSGIPWSPLIERMKGNIVTGLRVAKRCALSRTPTKFQYVRLRRIHRPLFMTVHMGALMMMAPSRHGRTPLSASGDWTQRHPCTVIRDHPSRPVRMISVPYLPFLLFRQLCQRADRANTNVPGQEHLVVPLPAPQHPTVALAE